ncbi:hypothetical protein CYMTET_50976 [Cymbomonas tetramitiformis]|uniref:Uncharacterized protein n=1 Tax=Cymbomonas tetramitiformis TaxID=36881 RepID=A0AAE0BNA4_9CHLO|nr:hypothetical protein CYMTET_50976 [Cymbomonas tetramitiformis]
MSFLLASMLAKKKASLSRGAAPPVKLIQLLRNHVGGDIHTSTKLQLCTSLRTSAPPDADAAAEKNLSSTRACSSGESLTDSILRLLNRDLRERHQVQCPTAELFGNQRPRLVLHDPRRVGRVGGVGSRTDAAIAVCAIAGAALPYLKSAIGFQATPALRVSGNDVNADDGSLTASS